MATSKPLAEALLLAGHTQKPRQYLEDSMGSVSQGNNHFLQPVTLGSTLSPTEGCLSSHPDMGNNHRH